jgi:hypothetical protein
MFHVQIDSTCPIKKAIPICFRLWARHRNPILIDSSIPFLSPLQEIRDKVKLLLQLAETLLSSGNNVHTQAISHWSDNVDLKYKDFSCRIDQLK